MNAAFCGSFDPVTLGHLHLMQRAAPLFETVFVFVSQNSQKTGTWPAKKRAAWVREACQQAGLENVQVQVWEGLAVEAAAQAKCQVLLRGIRNSVDLEYEANMAYMNRLLDGKIETMSLFCAPEDACISSSNVRELLHYGRSIASMVPACVFRDLQPEFQIPRKDQE